MDIQDVFLKKKLKKKNDEGVESLSVWLGSVAMGLLMTTYGYGGKLGLVFTGIGTIGTVIDIVDKYNPYRILFQNTNIEINNQTPHYLGKVKTSYGYCLRFSLPIGLSTDDFKKKQLAIEQYLNKEIEIEYKDKQVFIKVFESQLLPEYDYEYIKTKNICEFPIGYTHGNKLITINLEKTIHTLIAGETGSGKSTLLRCIITHLILNNSSSNLKLHLIDLKNGAEFNIFKDCELVESFSRNIDEAFKILIKLTHEVDKRYNTFFKHDVVSIQEYNRIKNIKKMNYQIIVIDEFSDLVYEKEAIKALETLASKSRAAGIYLIISTQRPDANIINGRIKANFPCIIGLKTTNATNSRIIIDEKGLEDLNGSGHGLLKYGGINEFQGMYLSAKKAKELIKHKIKTPILNNKNKKQINKKTNDDIGEVKDFRFLKILKGGK